MRQKITVMLFLSIGISIFFLRCQKKIEELPIKTASYVYVNKLNDTLEFSVYNGNQTSSFYILPLDSLTLIQEGETPYPFSGQTIGNVVGDSVRIKFFKDSCVNYKKDFSNGTFGGYGVFDLNAYDNYNSETLSQKSYVLSYSIDSLDFKKSKKCK